MPSRASSTWRSWFPRSASESWFTAAPRAGEASTDVRWRIGTSTRSTGAARRSLRRRLGRRRGSREGRGEALAPCFEDVRSGVRMANALDRHAAADSRGVDSSSVRAEPRPRGLSFLDRYLTVWLFAAMGARDDRAAPPGCTAHRDPARALLRHHV